MEEKKPKHIPPPGIPEALHPHIGNGVAWEQHMHEFLLRHPDASKQLEWRLLPEEAVVVEIMPPLPQVEVNEKVSPEVLDPSELIKPKRKKKPSKEEKSEEAPDATGDEPKLEKRQKAGKLIKKAAKTVKRQEAEKNLPESPDSILREITLSPYTNWLKSLAGSEYVHPYDEDYAFHQGVDPSGGGISETFADLLASQGYKEQAIEMYMRLMEKYPEKSSFFAAKIEALQQQ